ncbi:MAG: hypothetical protein V9E99_13455 [Microthrixaceae bacterium]
MTKALSTRTRLRRHRGSLLLSVGLFAFVAASCTPPPTTVTLGPFTVPLPPIGAEATPVDYVIDIPGIPPQELTPYIPPQELTPYIPPQQLTPYIPPVCTIFGCTPEVPATYSPAIPATYSPAIPATYSPAIPGGSCTASYTPPSFFINGATATLPLVNVDLSATTVTIPNVTVNIPAANLVVGAGSVGCSIQGLPGVTLPTGDVRLTFPAQALVREATLDLKTHVLTLKNPSFTVTGVGMHFLGLNADFDLPDIEVPLPTVTVPLT